MKLKRANGGWEISHGVKTRWEPSFLKALGQIPEVWSEAHVLHGENFFVKNCEPSTPAIDSEYVRAHTHISNGIGSWVKALSPKK